MMETALTSLMDENLIEELSKISQRFRGKIVKVTIIEVNESELKRRKA